MKRTHAMTLAGTAGPWLAILFIVQPAVGGGPVVWPQGSTQFVISDLTVTDTLTIESGVTVHLNAGVEILVAAGGTLQVEGAEDDPVLFTSNGPSRWDGIKFANGSLGVLEHATIEHTNTVGLSLTRASPVFDGCTIRDVAGIAPGGWARGIHVFGAGAKPTIFGCLVENIAAAVGAVGANTGAAGDGGNGADGTFFFPNADNGGGGSPGAIGGTGGVGGTALGVVVESGARASLSSNRVRNITGGAGGKGGNGGAGGDGGSGGEGANGIFPGSSGNGGNAGAGGKGGTGGLGGSAHGVRLDLDSLECAVHQHLIVGIASGPGGQGGNGGIGGAGGDGGNGLNLIPAIANTDGGDAGNGGTGGAAGTGGASGMSRAIDIPGEEALVSIVQGTLANMTVGSAGAAGFANVGGPGGSGGFAWDPAEQGGDGDDGGLGAAGQPGATGSRQGIVANDDSEVSLRNSIVALGAPADGIALVASGGATIDVFNSCLAGFETVSQGAVALAEGNFLVDPMFVDPSAGDYSLASSSACIDAGGELTLPYRRDAIAWMGAAGPVEARAFDEFAPGITQDTGCLLGAGVPQAIELATGTMTVTAIESGGGLECAIVDGSTPSQVSDASMTNGATTLRLEFDPPVLAFYAYIGSLTMGDHATLELFSSNVSVDEVVGASSPHNVLASGLGMLRTSPIDRIDVTVGVDTGSVMGAFVGLAAGEPSLGVVTIPGYNGPAGSGVALDFACDFGPGADVLGAPRLVDGNADKQTLIDIGAVEFQVRPTGPPCPADLNGDGLVDGADFGVLLGSWGGPGSADLSGDGVVDGVDLGVLLGAWGECGG